MIGLLECLPADVMDSVCSSVMTKATFTQETRSGSIWFGSSWSGSNCVHTSSQVDPGQVDLC